MKNGRPAISKYKAVVIKEMEACQVRWKCYLGHINTKIVFGDRLKIQSGTCTKCGRMYSFKIKPHKG